MIVPPYEAKCYGAVHIDNYLSFIGFCKKVYSDEVCKVDVFLDDERIDSILCDKIVDKIEQIYEIGSHCFKYELDDKYFDKRHMLSFKCDGEELLHSPIETISKDDEKYNEYKFLHSLENTDYEELKDVYKPNSIGFLATRENLEDEEFVEFINEIIRDFPEYDFKALYFNESDLGEVKEKFSARNLEYLRIKEARDLYKNLQVLLCNQTLLKIDSIILNFLTHNATNLYASGTSPRSNKTIKEHSLDIKSYYRKLLDSTSLFRLSKDDYIRFDYDFIEISFLAAAKKYNKQIEFNPNDNIKNLTKYALKIGFDNQEYYQYLIQSRLKYIELND